MTITPTIRRAIITAAGGLLLALNRKLGLDLDATTVGAIALIVTAYLTQSGAVTLARAWRQG